MDRDIPPEVGKSKRVAANYYVFMQKLFMIALSRLGGDDGSHTMHRNSGLLFLLPSPCIAGRVIYVLIANTPHVTSKGKR